MHMNALNTFVSSTGQVFMQKELDPDKKERIDYLQGLRYPQDRHTIERLPSDDFKDWIYLIPPLEALKISLTRKFSWMRQRRDGKETLARKLIEYENDIRVLSFQLETIKNRWWYKLFSKRWFW